MSSWKISLCCQLQISYSYKIRMMALVWRIVSLKSTNQSVKRSPQQSIWGRKPKSSSSKPLITAIAANVAITFVGGVSKASTLESGHGRITMWGPISTKSSTSLFEDTRSFLPGSGLAPTSRNIWEHLGTSKDNVVQLWCSNMFK